MAYNVLQLPYPIVDDEDLSLRVKKNLEYLADSISRLQVYENATGIPVNGNFDSNKDFTGTIKDVAAVATKTAGGIADFLDGFGDGHDGDFNSTGNVTLTVPNEDISTIVKQYNSFTLNAGHTLTVDKRCRGLIIYVRGNCTISGIIDMSGKSAKVSKTNSLQKQLQIPVGTAVIDVSSGGAGGNGGRGGYWTTQAAGRNGSTATWFGGGFGGGGGGGQGGPEAGYSNDASPAGTADLDSAIGSTNGSNFAGGGGGTGAVPAYNCGGGGGGAGFYGGTGGAGKGTGSAGNQGASTYAVGGGLVVIVCKGNLTINSGAYIKANGVNGGNGGNGGDGGRYGGGGGGQGGSGGGVIALAYRGTFTNNGTLQVNAGSGGALGSPGTGGSYGTYYAAVAGTAGSIGTILTQAA